MNAVLLLIFITLGQQPSDSTLERIEKEITAVVEKTRPSVVQVIAELGDDSFQNRRGVPPSIRFTGIIVAADGHILTDLGGARVARKLQVILHDGRRFTAFHKASDEPTAVALLKVDAAELTPVTFAEPDSIRQGSIAVLVSNPAGLAQSSTVGFVSGVNRSIRVDGARFDDMLQTSAPVQSGDVGGLLANARGTLVGMIHSRYVPDGIEPDPAGFLRPIPREGLDFVPAGGPTIGFATPGPTLRFVADRLMKFGVVRRGWAGLGLQRTAKGSQAVEVTHDGPAWKAGLRRGDLVLEFDGRKADDLPALRRQVIESDLPRTVKVRVQRGDRVFELDLGLVAETSRP